MKKAKHPHIIQLLDLIEKSSKIFVIMEYAKKQDLYDYIESRQGLKESEACRLYQ